MRAATWSTVLPLEDSGQRWSGDPGTQLRRMASFRCEVFLYPSLMSRTNAIISDSQLGGV